MGHPYYISLSINTYRGMAAQYSDPSLRPSESTNVSGSSESSTSTSGSSERATNSAANHKGLGRAKAGKSSARPVPHDFMPAAMAMAWPSSEDSAPLMSAQQQPGASAGVSDTSENE